MAGRQAGVTAGKDETGTKVVGMETGTKAASPMVETDRQVHRQASSQLSMSGAAARHARSHVVRAVV